MNLIFKIKFFINKYYYFYFYLYVLRVIDKKFKDLHKTKLKKKKKYLVCC